MYVRPQKNVNYMIVHIYLSLLGYVCVCVWVCVQDMTEVCQDELAKLRRLEDTTSGGGGAERRGGVNSAVSSDITAIFKGKTVSSTVNFYLYATVYMSSAVTWSHNMFLLCKELMNDVPVYWWLHSLRISCDSAAWLWRNAIQTFHHTVVCGLYHACTFAWDKLCALFTPH